MTCRIPTALLATLPALACAPDANPDPQVPDDAGSPASPDTIWHIDPAPTLVLGLLEGPAPHLFSQIRAATRLSTGTVVVLDGASQQLRAFSPDGTHLWTAGGPGEGPGEMRNATHLETLPGDTLQVQDGIARIRFAADGSLVAHERLAHAELREFGQYYASECALPNFVGHHVLACSGGFDARMAPRDEGPWRTETELAVLPWTLNSIAHLGVFLNEEAWALPYRIPRLLEQIVVVGAVGGGLGYASPPMSRKGVFAVGGWPRKLAVADGWGDEVRTFDLAADPAIPGTTIRIRHVRRPPTADELAAAWEAVSNRGIGSPENVRERLPAPDSIPNIDHLVGDNPGAVWVASYQADPSVPRLYHVYDPEVGFLARAAMPPGVEVFEIGPDYVLGLTRDDLDVERVVVLSLDRSP